MRKFLASLSVVLTVICCIFGASACGGGNNGENDKESDGDDDTGVESVFGVYDFYSYESWGNTYKVGDEFHGDIISQDFVVFDFKEDSFNLKIKINEKNEIVTGDYSGENGIYELRADIDGVAGELFYDGEEVHGWAYADGDIAFLYEYETDVIVHLRKRGSVNNTQTTEGTYMFDALVNFYHDELNIYEAGESYGGITLNADSVIMTLNADGTYSVSETDGETVSTGTGSYSGENGEYYLNDGDARFALYINGDKAVLYEGHGFYRFKKQG